MGHIWDIYWTIYVVFKWVVYWTILYLVGMRWGFAVMFWGGFYGIVV